MRNIVTNCLVGGS